MRWLKILSTLTEFNDYFVQTYLEFNDSIVKAFCWIISVSKMERQNLAPVPSGRSFLSIAILHELS